jgi:hypothetical protein
MMFYHLFVHRDSFTLFILILARPSIKFLIVFYWKSLINLDYLHFTLSVSKATYQIIFLRSCLTSFLLPFLYCWEYHKAVPLVLFCFISARIKHSKCLLFADDLKIYWHIKSVEDCKSLQVGTDSVHQWCGENCMELNIQKSNIISFTHKTNSIHFNYHVRDVLVLRSYCKKALGVMLESKFYFHHHVEFVYSQALKTLGLIRYITYNFSSLHSLFHLML